MSIATANSNIASFNRYVFNATGGETSLSGVDANGNTLSYTVGKEEVYLNGVRLVSGTDYTATTGSSITGLTALAASDVVEIVAFGTFVVATAMGAAQTTPPTAPVEGLIWLDTDGTAPSYTLTRWSKTTSAGTTVLSGNDDNAVPLSFTANYEYVYLNGALLSRGNDYTTTGSTTVTLTSATLAGDLVEVYSQSAYTLGDSYTKTQSDSKYVTNPLTTTGDIIYSSSGTTASRLGIGSTNQTILVSGGVPTWGASPQSLMTATGDVLYASSANTPARLGIGSTNQVLTVSGGVPTWGSPATGTWTQVASGNVTSGTTIAITGLATAKRFMFAIENSRGNQASSGSSTTTMTINGDSGSNYYNASNPTTNITVPIPMGPTGTGYYGAFIIDFADSTTVWKTVWAPGVSSVGSYYKSAAVVSSFTINANSTWTWTAGAYTVWAFN